MLVNEITYEEIGRLNDVQLSELLLLLLRNEAAKYEFEGIEQIIVPLRINVADGGEDGRVKCLSTNDSIFIHKPFSLFQCKATDLSPQDLYDEFFTKDANGNLILKLLIKEVLDGNGEYVFFIRKDYNSSTLKNRFDKAKEAIDEANRIYGTNYQHSQVRILDGNQIANWTNNFISTVIQVQAFCGIERPMGLKSLSQWGEFEDFIEIPFHTNDKLDQHKKLILSQAAKVKNSLRVIGHSGLGKSRLVFETFKGNAELSAKVAYYDIVSDADDIIKFVRNFCSRLEGILVVDNCDFYSHELLVKEITRITSKFSLVTIDYSVEEKADKSKTIGRNYVFLDRSDYSDVVPKILTDVYSGSLKDSVINQISEYSEGYPQMAVLFAKAKLEGINDFTDLLRDDLKERLVFGRDYSKKESFKELYQVIKSSSIFLFFGYPALENHKHLTEDEKLIYENQQELIYSKICVPPVHQRQFNEGCDLFLKRGVMERRGHYVAVKPTPLALKLAVEWWKVMRAGEFKTLFPLLEKTNLAIPLVDRLKNLDQLQEAKQIVNEIWGPQSPFGSAEVLNTSLGSYLFRSIVDVNPTACLKTLESIYFSKSIEEIRDEENGRRNLVWALEKLCFRKETFVRASKVLFRFAVAENENLGNNATNQFLQLFHVYLPGTESNLESRIGIIDYGLSMNDSRYLELAIKALGNGLTHFHFYRISGPEFQGSSEPLSDYTPKIEEIYSYWDSILKRLIEIIDLYPNMLDLIGEQVVQAITPLSESNHLDLLETIILKISKLKIKLWPQVIENLHWALRDDAINSIAKSRLKNLLNNLLPVDDGNLIKIKVSFPQYDYDENNHHDIQKENVENFAESIGYNYKAYLTPYLFQLLEGEQRQGFNFGIKIGQYAKNDLDFVSDVICELRKIDAGQRTVDFLAGLVLNFDIDNKRRIVSQISNDNELNIFTVYLTKLWLPNKVDIINLFKLVDSGKIKIIEFSNFIYGRPLDNLKIEEVVEICDKISHYGNEGKWIALTVIYQYCREEKDKLKICSELIKSLITENNFLLNDSINKSIDRYYWSDSVEKILTIEKSFSFAKTVSSQIYEAADKGKIDTHTSYLKKLCSFLVKEYFSIFFNEISPLFLSIGLPYLKMKFLLGAHHGSMPELGVLFHNPEGYNEIITFCKQNFPVAPKRIAYIMPIYKKENDKDTWHEFALMMLKEFGSDEGFLKELGANMSSFSITGSVIPYYRLQINLLNHIKDHSHQSVRDWVDNRIDYLNRVIIREDLDEQNQTWT